MPLSESRKRANNKWTKANMATIACKLKKEQAEQFRAYCDREGTTPNAVLKDYILNIIEKDTPGD